LAPFFAFFAFFAVKVFESAANMYHGSRCGHEIRFADMMPFFLALNHFPDEVNQVFV
jgi:hypothetical protein